MATDKAVLTVLLVLVCLAFHEEVAGLKCRVDHDERTQDGFQDVVRACMNVDFRDEENNSNNPHRNTNTDNNWQYRPQWSQEIPRFPTKERGDDGRRQDEDDEQESSREGENGRGDGSGRGGGGGGGRPRGYRPHGPRTRRASPPRNIYGSRHNTTRRHPGSSPLEDIEPCAIHCIFRQMKMLDSNNRPDKGSVLGVMTGKLRDPTLRTWLRDTISECFDILDSENQETKCSMTKSFAMCLEQKGQQNCEDWDDEIRKPGPKHNSFTPSKHRGG